jgi:hypothetical protein
MAETPSRSSWVRRISTAASLSSIAVAVVRIYVLLR